MCLTILFCHCQSILLDVLIVQRLVHSDEALGRVLSLEKVGRVVVLLLDHDPELVGVGGGVWLAILEQTARSSVLG